MWWVVGTAFTVLPLVLYVPMLRGLFHFSTLHASDVALCLGAGVLSLAWFETLKVFRGTPPVA
jgi:Ca2+-transporting ATPase